MSDIKSLPVNEQKRALEWQCRRGIKEIEVLLIPFLENHFAQEDRQVREDFIDLLRESDLDMFEWFTRREVPDNDNLASIVNIILRYAES